MYHLDISEHVLRGYRAHGDSVLFANLIHFTRQFVRNILNANWETFSIYRILSLQGLEYSVQNTLPGLQHDFCRLWNEIVLQRHDTDHPILNTILERLRSIYFALHQGSSPDGLNQLCSIPSHLIGPTCASILIEAVGVRTPETDPTPIPSPAPPSP